MNPRLRSLSTRLKAVRNAPPAGLFDDEEPTHPTAESLIWERRTRAIEASASCFAVNNPSDPWEARRKAVRWHDGA